MLESPVYVLIREAEERSKREARENKIEEANQEIINVLALSHSAGESPSLSHFDLNEAVRSQSCESSSCFLF
jgi:hypothetical protein